MRTPTSPKGPARVATAATITLASIVLSSGAAAAISYRVGDNVRGTMVPTTADHPAGVSHVRGTHLRTEPAPTSLGSTVAGGRVIVR